MKRSSLFMWAYICFIVIATVIRLFTDYVIWQPIVIAVTVSGTFFALEQLFSVVYKKYDSYTTTFTIWITETEESIKENIKSCSEQLNIAKSLIPYESKMEESVNLFSSIISMLKNSLEPVTQAKATLEGFEKRKKLYSWLSTTFAFVGFFALFISLIVCTKMVIPQLLQDVLTVIPFSIILITQQLEPLLSEQADTLFTIYQNSLIEQSELNQKAKKLICSFQTLHSYVENNKVRG